MSKTKLSLPAKANVMLGKIIYKNGANFLNNYRGVKRWKSNKNMSSGEFEFFDEAEHLHQYGYTEPKFYFDAESIKNVANEFNIAIKDKKQTDFRDKFGRVNTEESKNFTSAYWIKNPIKSMPSIKNLFTPEFIELVRSYYQSEFRVHSIESWQTNHISQDILDEIYPASPYSLFWHTDGHRVDTTKFFMVLSDVTNDHGPLHFISKERTSQLFKKGFVNRFISIDMKDEIESEGLKKLTGKSGTAAFCNTPICLHRAGIPNEGKMRQILEFRFESSDMPFNPDDL